VKRRRAEASCKWTVRAREIDGALSAKLAEQLALVAGWPDVTLPLRK
jgi:hypothetical protein